VKTKMEVPNYAVRAASAYAASAESVTISQEQ
jgi:hypothetical protein